MIAFIQSPHRPSFIPFHCRHLWSLLFKVFMIRIILDAKRALENPLRQHKNACIWLYCGQDVKDRRGSC